jgi:N-acyl-D-amino-acid deacylase
VMGNCGFTIAPCAEKDKALVLRNLERSEEISPAAMEAGVSWSWTTFPQFLDALDRLPKGINYASHVGHSALRTYAMGERAFTEKATADDLKVMTDELRSAMRAGAVGLSTSRTANHKTPDGGPVASRVGDWSEVEALVGVMSELGEGVFEISREVADTDPVRKIKEREMMKALALQSGVKTTFGSSWFLRRLPNDWTDHLAMVDETLAAGGNMMMQATATWNGSLRSFETIMLFDRAPVWKELRQLPLAEQEKAMRDPEVRRKLVEATKNHQISNDPTIPNALRRPIDWNWIFPYDRAFPPFRSIAQMAKETGKDPVEVVIDLALEKHLKLFFLNPNSNEDQDFVLKVIKHPKSVITFTDSGAHVTSVINPVQTYLLGYWVRERQEITMEAAVKKMTSDIASYWGLTKRGLLHEGNFADLVIFDPKTIAPALPSLARDLPAGAERLLQKSVGIKNTIVNGQVLMEGNDHGGALPGRLLRGPATQR